MRVPEWGRAHQVAQEKEEVFAMIDETETWTKHTCLGISALQTTFRAIELAATKLHTVRRLQIVSEITSNDAEKNAMSFFLLALIAAPNLRCLEITYWLNDDQLIALTSALKRQTQITQLSVQMLGDDATAVREFFDSLLSMRLTALSLMAGLNATEIGQLVCAFARKCGTLQSLTLRSDVETVWCDFAPEFVCHSLTELFLASCLKMAKSRLHVLFQSLMLCRLRFLEFEDFPPWPELEASGLVHAGWLTHIEPAMKVPATLKSLIRRNVARHASCCALCLTLIALRKGKRALLIVPIDVVRIIAESIYETRNQSVWDARDSVASGR